MTGGGESFSRHVNRRRRGLLLLVVILIVAAIVAHRVDRRLHSPISLSPQETAATEAGSVNEASVSLPAEVSASAGDDAKPRRRRKSSSKRQAERSRPLPSQSRSSLASPLDVPVD